MSPRSYIAEKILMLSVSGLIKKMMNELMGSTCKSKTAGVRWLKVYYQNPMIIEGHKLTGYRAI